MRFEYRLFFSFWIVTLCGVAFSSPFTYAAERYETIVLTQNRVCRGCIFQMLNKQQVQLTNRQGQSTVVDRREIIGLDRHPLGRKVLTHMLHGIGLPGPIIVPHAFENSRDYVCKYCDP